MRQRASQNNDVGSITAEFALTLPAIALVLSITLGASSLQLQRLELISLAASASRALARGETVQFVETLKKQFGSGFEVSSEVSEDLICAKASKTASLGSVPGFNFDLAETECSRKSGL
ncbi:MAG: hypothetical protein RL716_391 [Actinomycetota bacterium]